MLVVKDETCRSLSEILLTVMLVLSLRESSRFSSGAAGVAADDNDAAGTSSRKRMLDARIFHFYTQ